MYRFNDDYSEGAHPRILNALLETNMVQTVGYGEDEYSLKAVEILKQKLKNNNVHIHMLSGGTQTNMIAISAFLKPYEAAIAASTGHIAVHETGAVEGTGHKILTVETNDGKLTPSKIKPILDEYTDEHMVKPALVYISESTEIGTVYNKKELAELSKFCRENDLILYMDGARLGSALCSKGCDLELSDLTNLLDAFYIGGTKNGALIGEALVICNDMLNKDFRYTIKHRGAMLAKGRLIGIQFLELFKDDLYFDLAKHANEMADILRDGISKAGYKFISNSPTNQIFPVLPNQVIEKLNKKFSFNTGDEVEPGKTAIRLVTSWATDKNAVLDFVDELNKASK